MHVTYLVTSTARSWWAGCVSLWGLRFFCQAQKLANVASAWWSICSPFYNKQNNQKFNPAHVWHHTLVTYWFCYHEYSFFVSHRPVFNTVSWTHFQQGPLCVIYNESISLSFTFLWWTGVNNTPADRTGRSPSRRNTGGTHRVNDGLRSVSSRVPVRHHPSIHPLYCTRPMKQAHLTGRQPFFLNVIHKICFSFLFFSFLWWHAKRSAMTKNYPLCCKPRTFLYGKRDLDHDCGQSTGLLGDGSVGLYGSLFKTYRSWEAGLSQCKKVEGVQ